MPSACYHCAVKTQTEIQTYLQTLPDLSAFSQDYRLPLRTLLRVKLGQGKPTKGTLTLVDSAIKRHERKKEKA